MKIKNRAVWLLVVVLFINFIVWVCNTQEGDTTEKTFTIEVVSARDQIFEVTEHTTDCEFLGQYLRESGDWSYDEGPYGLYVRGYKGYYDDESNQYWWCLYVNGEMSQYAADEVPLKEGDVYQWELKEGW